MAGGWSRDGAVQDQIDTSVNDAIAQVRAHLPKGESQSHCLECDAEIPEARRIAIPGVTHCVQCQSERDQQNKNQATFNRRGSKDSQLR